MTPFAEPSLVSLASPSAYPLEHLKVALTAKEIAWRQATGALLLGSGYQILYGTFSDAHIRERLASLSIAPSDRAESLSIALVPEPNGAKTLLVAGSDERGLSYALYEALRSIELEGSQSDPFRGIVETNEAPELVIRSAIRTLMNRDLDATWFRSSEFWQKYLDTLVATRHNRFKLSIGWRSAYFSPPYPYLIETPGFESVTVTHLTPEERQENLSLLRQISAQTKARGLEFYLDTYWLSHHPMGDWQEARKYIIEGITDRTSPDYTKAGIAALLRACPQIDGIGMSGSMIENGVSQEFMNAFFDGIAGCGRPMAIQIELKGVNQALVDQAVRRGIHVTLGGKSCMEHKGLPYHPTQIRLEELGETRDLLAIHTSGRRWTRNSYADMLYRPRSHDFMFNLWNWGTQKVLLWGDPDDVARLARNSLISGSLGMEHGDPLTYKGSYSSGPSADWRIFQDTKAEYYDWEFERYWYHYLLYGRLMYNSHTNPTVWRREFVARFGEQAADDLIRALAYASKTTPLMTTVHAPSASDNSYWPEIYTNIPITVPDPMRRDGGSTFGLCNPSDTALFYAVDSYVQDYLDNNLTAQYSPITVATWFTHIGNEAIAALQRAEATVQEPMLAEFQATRLDILVQAYLALFFAKKLEAATEFGFYREAGDYGALLRAIAAYEQALEEWRQIVALTKDRYQSNLAFHRNGIMSGSWQDREAAIVSDIEQMKQLQCNFLNHYEYSAVAVAHVPVWVQPHSSIRIDATGKGWAHIETFLLHYRTDPTQAFQVSVMEQEQAGTPLYSYCCAALPNARVFEYFLEAKLKNGTGVIFPGDGSRSPLRLHLASQVKSPLCRHSAPPLFEGGKPLALTLDVQSSETELQVRLRYRHVNQAETILAIAMEGAAGAYRAEIPATYTNSTYDLMYYFEVSDRAGNRVLYPGLEQGADAPYFVVERQLSAPN